MSKKILTMANIIGSLPDERPLGIDTGANIDPGVIIAANASRFDEGHFSEPLTTYAVGHGDADDLVGLLNFLCPDVTVPRKFEFAKATNAEGFIAETGDADIRAINADFKRVDYTSSKVNEKTHNKGLTYRVDRDNLDEANEPDWQQKRVGLLINRLRRTEIRRAYALHIANITSESGNTAKVWSTGATDKNPDIDVLLQVDAFGDVTGLNANRVLYGFSAWTSRASGYANQSTAGGFGGAGRMSESEVATAVGVDRVRISKERYTSSSTAKSKLTTAGVVLIYNVLEGATTDDPSTIKRFVSNTNGGTAMKVYVQEHGVKFVDITCEFYSNIIITYAGGEKSLTIT